MSILVDVLKEAGTTIAIFVAAWAAWEAKRAADASRASIETQIVHSAMSEYFQNQMVSNIRVLRRWRDLHGENFAAKWFKELENAGQEGQW